MRDGARVNNRPIPYLFNNYNVDAFHPGIIGSSTNSPLTRILNSLVYAVNKHHLLPRFIIMITDWDIIKAINYYDFGISKIIGANLEWLINEVDRLICTKKIDLFNEREGSVMPTAPKVLWIRMIPRPAPSRVLALRRKYNAILEETLCHTRGGMYILDAHDDLNGLHYDRVNQLLETGKTTYWKSIDTSIKDFDRHKGPNLKPNPVISNAAPTKKEPRFALLRPPPAK